MLVSWVVINQRWGFLLSSASLKHLPSSDFLFPFCCFLIATTYLQVCGLKWSYDNRELASGGNDNRVCCWFFSWSFSLCFVVDYLHFSWLKVNFDVQLFVWNNHSTQPVLKYCEHTAAVKAIAWSPHLHGLLASGGGTADRCIRFWNTTTNTHLSCMDTGSQVWTIIASNTTLFCCPSVYTCSFNNILQYSSPDSFPIASTLLPNYILRQTILLLVLLPETCLPHLKSRTNAKGPLDEWVILHTFFWDKAKLVKVFPSFLFVVVKLTRVNTPYLKDKNKAC